jgi:hypothetical protein
LPPHLSPPLTPSRSSLQSCSAALSAAAAPPSNTINCLPGCQALTDKASLAATLSAAYGADGAAAVLPRTFALPSQQRQLAAHVRASGAGGAWVLKEGTHRGQGVVAVEGGDVVRRARERTPAGRPRFVLAQRFLADQLLVEARPVTLRVWAVLAAGASGALRCHVFDRAILLFGDKRVAAAPAARAPQDMLVNIFQQNRSTAPDPWALSDLEAHLAAATGGAAAFEALWGGVRRSTAAAAAAAAPAVRRAAPPRYQGGGLEVVGLDFVIDSAFRPWLVEINRMPSMARKVPGCRPPGAGGSRAGERRSGGGARGAASGSPSGGGSEPEACRDNPMDREKAAFLRALLELVAGRRAGAAAAVADEAAAAVAAWTGCGVTAQELASVVEVQREAEAAQAAGFSALTPLLYRARRCMAAGDASGCGALPPPPPPYVEAEAARPSPRTAGSMLQRASGALHAALDRALDASWALGRSAPPPQQQPPPPEPLSREEELLAAWLDSAASGSASASVGDVLSALCEAHGECQQPSTTSAPSAPQ